MSTTSLRGEQRQGRVESYRAHVNPHRVAEFEALGWTDKIEQGEGSFLVDAAGRRILDMCCGFGAAAFGHHPRGIDDALRKVIDSRTPYVLPLGIAAGVGELAARLCAIAGGNLQKAYFGNSGAEGIEAAMKFAMMRTGRARFISFEGGYHGLTLGALGLVGGGTWRSPMPDLPIAASVAPFGDIATVERWLAKGDVAAVVTEVVQGAGGGCAWSGDSLVALEAICRRRGSLLVLDEVLSGFGRTGAWFAFQKVAPSLRPDVLVTSKGLTGGVIPLCAVLVTDDVFESVFGGPGRAHIHGSTFSANALAMAAGLSALDMIERECLIERAELMGGRLAVALRGLSGQGVVDVRGRGLLIGARIAGLEVPDDALGAFVCSQLLRERGVVVALAAHAPAYLKLTPPLTLSDAESELFIEALREALVEMGR